MPSSTSSSRAKAPNRATHRGIVAVLIGIALIGIAAEGIAVYGLHRVSKISRRIDQEYQDARQLRPYSASGKPTLLLLGNSLLLEGVDYPALKAGLSDKYDVHRLVVEQVEYLELYYILRKLFRQGARPYEVVFCTSVSHLTGDVTRGDFVARYIDPVDILELSHRKHLDATTASNYMFAHWSDWYANRVEIRKVLLGYVMPDMRDLTTVLGWRRAPKISVAEVQEKGEPRLAELKTLCDQYGSRLTILIPPVLAEDHADVVREEGAALGMRVLIPEQPGALEPSLFRDGLHLNSAGAALFTEKLEPEL